MLVEPVKTAGESPAPQVQARPPTGVEIARSRKEDGKEKGPSLSEIPEVAENLQANMNLIHDVDLNFTVHGGTGDIMVIVTDEKTGEVIREIPPREILNLATRLEEMIGLLFDQQG